MIADRSRLASLFNGTASAGGLALGWGFLIAGFAVTVALRPWIGTLAWYNLCFVSLFVTSKVATLVRLDDATLRRLSWRSLLAYLAWPGMRPEPFLTTEQESPSGAGTMVKVALIDLGVGGLLYWVLPRFLPAPTPLVVRLAVGITAHFLVFAMGPTALIAALYRWRGVGVDRPWQSPLAATSLADFWGVRWNRIFSGFARDMLFHPLARLVGVRKASFGVFLFSGLLHEWAFSVTALGGYGGPTAYFLLQWLGLQAEGTKFGRHLVRRNPFFGRVWTLLVLGLPLPLLVHEPFLTRVALPLLAQLGVPGV